MAGYEKNSRESILEYARRLLGTSLKKLYPSIPPIRSGKGGLGNAVEKYHFGYEPNSRSEPDFPEAGLELKCTPLKRLEDRSMVSKERLVLNIIDYEKEAQKSFEESSFWKKNAHLLLMFYLAESGIHCSEFLFKIVRLWNFPAADLKIIRDDWAAIKRKIVSGKAHEISEGDTFYLGACTKGSKAGKENRLQPISDTKAPQRAYSLKSKYLNAIVLESLTHPEMISDVDLSPKQKIKIQQKIQTQKQSASVLQQEDLKTDESFEQVVERKFKPYFGKTILDIERALGVEFGESKSMAYNVCKAIFHIDQSFEIAEFEKSDLQVKTIRLEENGRLKEAMSFLNIKYKEIVREENFEESELYRMFTRRFLFIVFRKSSGNLAKAARLERIKFWTMPVEDLKEAKRLWLDTKTKVESANYENFMRSSESSVCHIRPKGQNAKDLVEGAQGFKVKKMCYWLNREYVKNQLEQDS